MIPAEKVAEKVTEMILLDSVRLDSAKELLIACLKADRILARREGAEDMRERAVDVADDPTLEGGEIVAAIRALSLEEE